ncbi:flippase activity-associated protein Agl23 [Halomarina rubra]|uniref:Flippase activity-associated protein Agl23 n=1 Tax=Halomarina rubra TaxID=2071873 RepID=A0ABD6AW40_9EURY|nr:flippase activity-associated protein Agl23 [Halomarina rubra]
MATGTPSTTDRRSLTDRLPTNAALLAVLAITAVGLLARVVALGTRIAHQDEARVAYWILRYTESGAFEYRPVIHGPFLPIVNQWVFSALGPSDFTGRLVVALVGAAMPLAALLFRTRLRDSEVVALAALFAFNPLLLYYSRFMRSDVLIAVFMVVALGGLVRAYDTRHRRWLFVAVVAAAVALSAKENALLYPVCWLAGGLLLLDARLLRGHARGVRPRETLAGLLHGALGAPSYERARSRVRARGGHWLLTAVALVVTFLAVIVFFYAPRGGGYGEPYSSVEYGLYGSLDALLGGDPGPFAAVFEEATLGTWDALVDHWAKSRDHSYLDYLQHYLNTMVAGALAVSTLAVVGTLADRYREEGPRDLVMLGFFWGVFSVAGYPIVTDIRAPWAVVHAVVALAFPAAVGLALLARWGVEALDDADREGVALAAVVLLLVAGQVGYAAGTQVYFTDHDSTENQLVQYAQSSTQELKPLLDEQVAEITRENAGTDVLYYGQEFYIANESLANHPGSTGGTGWFDRLPMAWYVEQQEYRQGRGSPGVAVTSTIRANDVKRTDRAALPPVVIALANGSRTDGGNISDIDQYLTDYEVHEVQRYGYASAFVVYVREDWEAHADVESHVFDALEPGSQPSNTSAPGAPSLQPTPAPEATVRAAGG